MLLEHERLEAAWPKGATTVDHAGIGRRLEDVLDDIADIHELIADARPRTLAGALDRFDPIESLRGRSPTLPLRKT